MMIEYAKAHENHARGAIQTVQHIWPGTFNFFLFEDNSSPASQKLEVTVYPDTTDLVGELKGTLVHSRIRSNTFIDEEPASFLTYISRALGNIQ